MLVQAPQGPGKAGLVRSTAGAASGAVRTGYSCSRGQVCSHRRTPWGPSLHEDQGRVEVQIQAAEEGRTDLQKVWKVGSAMGK